MKKNILSILSISFIILSFFSCDQEDGKVDNHVFIDRKEKTEDVLIGTKDTDSQSFTLNMLQPLSYDLNCYLSANESKVNAYNLTYGTEAILLGKDYYTITPAETTISAGKITSSPIEVSFKNLTNLDRNLTYVLPVTLTADERVLESKSTIYYVVKAGALINVVADMKKSAAYINWVDPTGLTSMRKFTAEILLHPNAFQNGLSSVMGVEGKFLLRFGDSEPKDQLQIATSNGNYSSPNLVMKTGEWTHLALTYDSDAQEIQVYYDGILKYTAATRNIGPVNWGVSYYPNDGDPTRSFYIGYSYDSGRYFDGYMSECRIWDRILTPEELNAENHFYFVEPDSEGLLAYWKLNDGGGDVIKDYSSKGNNGAPATDYNDLVNPAWVKVSLGK